MAKKRLTKTQKAFKIVSRALKKDKNYYMTWQANIAMCFTDEAVSKKVKLSYRKLHKMANTAAKRFLDSLIG